MDVVEVGVEATVVYRPCSYMVCIRSNHDMDASSDWTSLRILQTIYGRSLKIFDLAQKNASSCKTIGR